MSLDFIPLGRFAPWYVAVAKGYYRDAGLDVKIVPRRELRRRSRQWKPASQYAMSDLAGLVVARAQGTTTARMIAIVYQKSPYAIYSLQTGAKSTQSEQLQGLQIASGAGSATPKIITGFLRDKGLDIGEVRARLDGAARVSMLLAER